MLAATDFLSDKSERVAPQLLGCIVERSWGDTIIRARIIETESYDQSDVASHSYNGPTPRTQVMFGAPGYAYVYFTYGMHYCFNIVCGESGTGSAVLIRAVEIIKGVGVAQRNRTAKSEIELTNGPAKLCQALQIDTAFNGHDLKDAPLRLIIQPPLDESKITTTTRIGISKSQGAPLRFYETNNPFVSKR